MSKLGFFGVLILSLSQAVSAADVTGKTLDLKGVPVPGATIRIFNILRVEIGSGVSAADGSYSIPISIGSFPVNDRSMVILYTKPGRETVQLVDVFAPDASDALVDVAMRVKSSRAPAQAGDCCQPQDHQCGCCEMICVPKKWRKRCR